MKHKHITPEQYEIARSNGIDKKNVAKRALYGTWGVERAITEELDADLISVEDQFNLEVRDE